MSGLLTCKHTFPPVFCLRPLQTSKDDLIQTDFEGALKYFRVPVPKRYRSEENAKKLMELACGMKVPKLFRSRCVCVCVCCCVLSSFNVREMLQVDQQGAT